MAVPGFIWDGHRFLGAEGHWWKLVGWLGNAIFFSRFFVQWIATERRRQVVVPAIFWWLSIAGSLALLLYGIFYLRDAVVIFAYAFTWIPYIRNIVIHYRHKAAQQHCESCGTPTAHAAEFCHKCGARIGSSTE